MNSTMHLGIVVKWLKSTTEEQGNFINKLMKLKSYLY